MSDPVLLDVDDDGIATLTLNDPDRMNPLNSDLSGALDAHLAELEDRDDVRCIVTRGAGDAFSAGGDIEGMKERIDTDQALDESVGDVERGLSRTMARLVDMPYPTIAKVDGPAVGAGANLAIAHDVVLAHEDAVIGFVFNQVGLSIDAGTSYFLPRIVGVNVAKELVLTGEIVDADRAGDLGLFNHVYADDEFEAEVEAMIDRIASGPTVAQRFARRLVQDGLEKPLERAMKDEAIAQGVVFDTEDHEEGVSAFLEKRDPEFQGR